MAVRPIPLRVTRGDDRTWVFRFRGADGNYTDLTGHVFASQVRKNYSDVTAIDLTCALGDQGNPNEIGQVAVSIASADSDVTPGKYHWDLQSDNGGLITTWAATEFIVDPEVTQ